MQSPACGHITEPVRELERADFLSQGFIPRRNLLIYSKLDPDDYTLHDVFSDNNKSNPYGYIITDDLDQMAIHLSGWGDCIEHPLVYAGHLVYMSIHLHSRYFSDCARAARRLQYGPLSDRVVERFSHLKPEELEMVWFHQAARDLGLI